MSQVLSQAEVDALLSAVSDSRPDDKRSKRRRNKEDVSYCPYDLSNEDRIIRGRMPTLDIVNDQFSLMLSGTLSHLLQNRCSVTVNSTGLIKAHELINCLEMNTYIAAYRIDGLRGCLTLILAKDLINHISEIALGGKPKAKSVQSSGRQMSELITPVETAFGRLLGNTVTEALSSAWEAIHPLRFNFTADSGRTQFFVSAPLNEVVIATTFDVEVGKGIDFRFKLFIPYSSLEPIKDKLSSGYNQERGARFLIPSEVIDNLPVTVTVQAAQQTFPLKSLTSLKVGDVIQFDKKATEPYKLSVNGKVRFEVVDNKNASISIIGPTTGTIEYFDPSTSEMSLHNISKIKSFIDPKSIAKVSKMKKSEGTVQNVITDNVPVTLSAELGRTTILLKDLRKFEIGTVVELDKVAGEPMEVFVGGKLVAKAEVVVVNEKFGLRITDFVKDEE